MARVKLVQGWWRVEVGPHWRPKWLGPRGRRVGLCQSYGYRTPAEVRAWAAQWGVRCE